MSVDRLEWVEIIEPRTKERMFANLATGECVWDPPEGVKIKRTNENQWWELFDTNTHRFYYYNVASQTTVWHRPLNCDIIPLAKLQTLKQYSSTGDVAATTTYDRREDRNSIHSTHSKSSTATRPQRGSSAGGEAGTKDRSRDRLVHSAGGSSSTTSSPQANKYVTRNDGTQQKYCRHKQQQQQQQQQLVAGGNLSLNQKVADSSKSSDSSISSGYRRLHDSNNVGGSLRLSSSQHQQYKNNYRMLQESSSSHNIPHVAVACSPRSRHNLQQHADDEDGEHDEDSLERKKPPNLPFSLSNSSDLAGAGGNSPMHVSTPLSKKKFHNDKHKGPYMETGLKSTSGATAKQHQSFDFVGNPKEVSLTRSGSFVSSPRHHPHQVSLTRNKAGNPDGSQMRSYLGINSDDDSMHEKYFKSVESTPQSRRRHTAGQDVLTTSKKSSDSSPQSPMSPQQKTKVVRPGHLGNIGSLATKNGSLSSFNSSHKKQSDSELLNLDLATKPERYMEKMKITDKGKTSPGSISNSSGLSLLQMNSMSKPGQHPQQQQLTSSFVPTGANIIKSGGSGSVQTPGGGPGLGSLQRNTTSRISPKSISPGSQDYFLNKPNLDRHNREIAQTERSTKKTPSKTTAQSNKRRQTHQHGNATYASDVDYDTGNMSPLYSNWDQEHLLPLQHYIIEQAKLSGCYRSSNLDDDDEPIDSDSLHSDTQSEHSFSGHEPDNEDSDHSDRGDYLAHHHYQGFGEDFGRSGQNYYNIMGFDRSGEKEDISSEVEAKLESVRDEIYSPVKSHHQFFQVPVGQSSHQPPKQQHTMPPIQQLQQSLQTHVQQSLAKILPSSLGGNAANTSSLPYPHHFHHPEEYPNQPIYGTQFGPVAPLAIMKETDIEKFAQDNLNLHSKGIFRKKSSVRDMLSWTSDAISRPMLALARDKAGKKMATEMFKLVQIYMGDRKARQGMSLNSVAIDIITMSVLQPQLRDELYVQLCRQTTENPMRESLIRGWELMAVCLAFLPPSTTFQPALLNYMNRHRDPSFATSFPEFGKWPIHVQVSHYATVACKRLDRIGSSGKKQAKKPTEEEVNNARDQIFRDSMFGNTLAEVMNLQRERFPESELPWIQVTLSDQVLLMGGKDTEGIFRVPADADEVNYLKTRLDQWEIPEYKPSMDAHVPASVLKLWYRELYDPLIPDELYDECVQTDDATEAAAIIEKLPVINRLVLTYLINFLQQFSQPEVVANTKMDSSNLAMVFAPNCLRCTSTDPKVILENARKEMAFIRTLIINMDTKHVKSLK